MSAIFAKLNLKGQAEILVLNAPASFEAELQALKGVAVQREVRAVNAIGFALAFVTRQKEVDAIAKSVTRKATGDALLWFAYPKGTSKRYTCDFNRDTGWKVLEKAGFLGVRMVAIDEDWSALRFRRTDFISALTRAPGRRASARSTKKRRA